MNDDAIPPFEEDEIEIEGLAAHLAQEFGDALRKIKRDEIELYTTVFNSMGGELARGNRIASTAMLAAWHKANEGEAD